MNKDRNTQASNLTPSDLIRKASICLMIPCIILFAERLLAIFFPTSKLFSYAAVIMVRASLFLFLAGISPLKQAAKRMQIRSGLLTGARVMIITDIVYYAIQVIFGMNFLASQILTLLSVFFSVPIALGLIFIFVSRLETRRQISIAAWIGAAVALGYTVFRFFYLFVFTFFEENGMVVFKAIRELTANYSYLSLSEYLIGAALFALLCASPYGEPRREGH